MRKVISITVILFNTHFSPFTRAQEIPISNEQQLENLADTEQKETEDDTWLQDLAHFRKDPLHINTADAEELKQLRILTDLQIDNLISYRNLFGHLVHIYELQAVPSWDIVTIRKLLPYITLAIPVSIKDEAGKRFREGEHSFLVRISQAFDPAATDPKYLGGPLRSLFRYRYNYKNLLQFGLTGDKDAGEQFFKGAQRTGFDFYSFHLFARKIGVIRSLALGDFTMNMGQGLIQWQSLAFKKSADITGVKRQSAILRPYSAADEFHFHRGAGITLQKGKTEVTAFISLRKLSANLVTDTASSEDIISSFLTSGYHRTAAEIADRNTLAQTAAGATVIYRAARWHAGVNGIYYRFSSALQKDPTPYNIYAIKGKHWYNGSFEYGYTYKNLHFFGEAAIDKHLSKAFVNGLLISVDPAVDLSLLHRHIDEAYQAVNGNAFTENTNPGNERGCFAGITVRPATGWRFDAYGDIFRFPWLRYSVDAPSWGRDLMAQISYTPNKQTEIYSRFRTEAKQANQPGNRTVSNHLVLLARQNWRTQLNHKLSPAIQYRCRIELLWYDKRGMNREDGFLLFSDLIYKPPLRPFSGGVRLQYFETDGYDSRIYAYENDVSFSNSTPAFFGTGFRYYANFTYDLSQHLTFWVRVDQTLYKNRSSSDANLNQSAGNGKTGVKVQVRWVL